MAEVIRKNAFEYAAKKSEGSIGRKIGIRIGEKAAQYAVEASAAFLGPLIVVVDAVMMVEMVLEMLDLVLTQLDVKIGFGQFQSIETIKNSMKDPAEIAYININKNMGIGPPHIFMLDDLWVLDNIEELPHFKEFDNYIGAIQAYMANLNKGLDKYLSQQDKIILRSDFTI